MPRQQEKHSFKPDLRFITMTIGVLLILIFSIIWWLYPNGGIAMVALIVLTAITAIANLGQWLTPTFTPVEAPPTTSETSRPPTSLDPPGPLLARNIPEVPQLLSAPDQQLAMRRHSNAPNVVLAQKHPFFFCVHLPDPSELYGRSIARDTIINRARHEGSTSLVGERRIGKTWLLEYTQYVLSDTQIISFEGVIHSFRVGCLDASSPGCSSVKGFVKLALEALGAPQKRVSGGLEKLEGLVKSLKRDHCVPVLCIDEFEGFALSREFDLKFFSELRAIANTGLVFVIASREPLIDAVTTIVGASEKVVSPFFNIFEQSTLKPFHKIEAETFTRAKSAQAGFTDAECTLMLRYGRVDEGKEEWPPMRLQLVGKLLLEAKDSGHYRPEGTDYWRMFEQQLAEKYSGVMRT